MEGLPLPKEFRDKDNSPLYFEICKEHYKICKENKRMVLSLFDEDKSEEMSDEKFDELVSSVSVYGTIYKDYMIIITFAAMCLEAFIYDYAATHFSDSFVKKYLDKLDLCSKWVIIPKLVTGNDFPTDSLAFQHLTKLVKMRNALVHSKSKPVSYIPLEQELRMRKNKPPQRDDSYSFEECYQCIKEIFIELRKIHTEPTIRPLGWWAFEEK